MELGLYLLEVGGGGVGGEVFAVPGSRQALLVEVLGFYLSPSCTQVSQSSPTCLPRLPQTGVTSPASDLSEYLLSV